MDFSGSIRGRKGLLLAFAIVFLSLAMLAVFSVIISAMFSAIIPSVSADDYEDNKCADQFRGKVVDNSFSFGIAGEVDCDEESISDVFVYFFVYNSTRTPNGPGSVDEVLTQKKAGVSGDIRNICKNRGKGWMYAGEPYGTLHIDLKELDPLVEEGQKAVLCMAKQDGSSGPRVKSIYYVPSAGQNLPEGAACGPKAASRGHFYSKTLKTTFTVCVEYSFAPAPSGVCDFDGVCSPGEGNCPDCNPCASRGTSYAEGGPAANVGSMKECQGDLNLFTEPSRNSQCKWCPVPSTDQPLVHARPGSSKDMYGVAFPYLLPPGSYSTSGSGTTAKSGCVDISVGDPFNCGGCGWSDEISDATILQRGNELTQNYCLAGTGESDTPARNTPFCVESEPNSGVWECKGTEFQDAAVNNPWFATYGSYVNPTYFYKVESDGKGGYRSSSIASTGTPISSAISSADPPEEPPANSWPEGDVSAPESTDFMFNFGDDSYDACVFAA
ncbi:hypothetical protein JW711_00125, partial [Candidatus Woesearchaeota archaeon]|nr:hypothetical protein [Candidatus Woesearchaeota archaeon]